MTTAVGLRRLLDILDPPRWPCTRVRPYTRCLQLRLDFDSTALLDRAAMPFDDLRYDRIDLPVVGFCTAA